MLCLLWVLCLSKQNFFNCHICEVEFLYYYFVINLFTFIESLIGHYTITNYTKWRQLITLQINKIVQTQMLIEFEEKNLNFKK